MCVRHHPQQQSLILHFRRDIYFKGLCHLPRVSFRFSLLNTTHTLQGTYIQAHRSSLPCMATSCCSTILPSQSCHPPAIAPDSIHTPIPRGARSCCCWATVHPHEWIHFLRRFHNFHNGLSTPPSTNIIIIIIGILHPRKASLRVSSEAPGATISSRSTSSVVEVERCGRALHAQPCTQEHSYPSLHILLPLLLSTYLHKCESSGLQTQYTVISNGKDLEEP